MGKISERIAIKPTSQPPRMSVLASSKKGFIESDITTPAEIHPFLKEWSLVWLNVDGSGTPELTNEIGAVFDLHPLALEDVLHLQERAKVDEYEDHVFIVVRMVAEDDDPSATEQISLFVSEKYVLSFQERAGGDCLNPTRERIRRRLLQEHQHRTPYLVYSILDSIIQAYFPVLENYGELLDKIEDEIAIKPHHEIIGRLHQIKRELLQLRRAVWPLRDVLQILMNDLKLFSDQEINFYLRNCADHVLQVMDLIETERELCADLMDFYLSSVGNRTNEVMKVLTIISVIFMPLTFIAGVYGMNFNTEKSPLNMPELNWYWGYPFTIGLMLVLALAMLYLFRRLKWL